MSDPQNEVEATAPRRDSPARRRRARGGATREAEVRGIQRASRDRLEWPALVEILALYAYSKPGRSAALEVVPFEDLDQVLAAQSETEELRSLIAERVSFRLAELPAIDGVLGEGGVIERRVLSGEELWCVHGILDRARSVGGLFRSRSDLPTLYARGQLIRDCGVLRERLEASIDSGGQVLSSASPELERIRDQCRREESEIRTWMERKRQTTQLRRALQGDVVTVRNGRFVFAIKAEYRGQVRGIVHGESASGSTLFIEPEEIVIRGNHLSELHERERREVARILLELTRAVQAERSVILDGSRHLVEIDVGLARARFANAFGCERPEVAEERHLKLAEARHPLLLWRDRNQTVGDIHDLGLPALRQKIVALELELGRPGHQIVVTGPNTGGKTVVLKLVGLLTIMAYSGIPIPTAAGARIPWFDSVLADIGDEQSLQQNLSTFSAHMTGIAQILRAATSRSLVLLDELGAGTDPLEGAALGEAILDRLYVRGTFTLVSTHLGSLKEFAFERRKCENACMEFDSARLAPTYRLLVGLPGKSNALIIAKRIGLPDEIIEAAERLTARDDRRGEMLIEGLERTHQDLERRKSAAERERRDAQRLREAAAAEVTSLRDAKVAIEYEAERAEEERVEALVHALTEALKQFGEPPRERREAYDALRQLLERARFRTRLAERRAAVASALRKGDLVFVPRLRAVAEVRKISKAKETLTVVVNGLATEVSFLDISWVLPPAGFELSWYPEGR